MPVNRCLGQLDPNALCSKTGVLVLPMTITNFLRSVFASLAILAMAISPFATWSVREHIGKLVVHLETVGQIF